VGDKQFKAFSAAYNTGIANAKSASQSSLIAFALSTFS